MKKSTKVLWGLILFGLIDLVIPLPLLAFTLIYVVLEQPPWFRELVDEVYHGNSGEGGER